MKLRIPVLRIWACCLLFLVFLVTPAWGYQLEGIASWYAGKFQGRLTANGETFDTNQFTAAHRELPFNTIVRVRNMNNGRTVVVRINDRGPFIDNRVIDLSRAAAEHLDMATAGLAPVRLEILHYEPVSTIRVLQIASFQSQSNALAAIQRLQGFGFAVTLEEAAELGVYRVVLPGIEEEDVPRVQEQLAAVGHASVLVRME